MTKRKRSGVSLKSLKPVSNLGDDIIRGLEQGLAHVRGETSLRTKTVTVPGAVDVRSVREKTGLSQAEFAARYGFSPRTLQEWEQGRAQPDSAVRAYLVVIDRNPRAVQEALEAS